LREELICRCDGGFYLQNVARDRQENTVQLQGNVVEGDGTVTAVTMLFIISLFDKPRSSGENAKRSITL